MAKRIERVKVAILKTLDGIGEAAGAARITKTIRSFGFDIQPRTVRCYLQQMDEEGLTKLISRRRGREITARGRKELERAHIVDKVGFVAAKVDELGYKMSFDLETGKGTVAANIALVSINDLSRALVYLEPVFARSLSTSSKLALAFEGDSLGDYVVPDDHVAFATVCSVTVNGILLKQGIPVISRFGGLVEMQDWLPARFIHLIEYRGTTIDPLEVFIRANLTSVHQCAEKGNGVIGVGFREVPSIAVDDIYQVEKKMKSYGIGGILSIGSSSRQLLDVDIIEGRTGLVVTAGLNPVAALHEAGIPVSIESLSGLVDVEKFSTFNEVAMKGRRDSPYID